jgi:hypothetical protein
MNPYNYKVGDMVQYISDEKSVGIIMSICEEKDTMDIYWFAVDKIFENMQRNISYNLDSRFRVIV